MRKSLKSELYFINRVTEVVRDSSGGENNASDVRPFLIIAILTQHLPSHCCFSLFSLALCSDGHWCHLACFVF